MRLQSLCIDKLGLELGLTGFTADALDVTDESIVTPVVNDTNPNPSQNPVYTSTNVITLYSNKHT